MNKANTLAKLNALLVLVQRRATEPRGAGPDGVPPFAPVVAPLAAQAVAPLAAGALDEPVIEAGLSMPTQPPPSFPEGELVVDVDFAEPAQDTTRGTPVIEEAPPVAVDGLGSRERLVAAEPAAPESAGEPPPRVAAVSSVPELEVAAVEHAAEAHADAEDADDTDDTEEPISDAPASSRRPLEPKAAPEEDLARIAFGAAEPRTPRHTPPPESGRLPAAPADEFEPDVTGVREASVVSVDESDLLPPEEAPGTAVDAAPALAADPVSRELVPEATRAQLVSGEVVTDVIGQAQRFAPSTFIALLDASLSL